MKNLTAYTLVIWSICAAAENPEVMERANSTLDNVSYKIFAQGDNSFYGVDALIEGGDTAKAKLPSVFVAEDQQRFHQLWSTYIDRDISYEELTNKIGAAIPDDKFISVFIFRGAQDSVLYKMKVDGCHRGDIKTAAKLFVDVTFRNPLHESYSYYKTYCSPYAVVVIEKKEISRQLNPKKVLVNAQHVTNQTIDPDEAAKIR